MFIKEDIYTTSSTVKLFHCWTDKVTKFDSSAFYNWEQDNMPVYDLEERTFYLWEKIGYPTSSIPGVVLAVSADAPDSAISCNKNIFRSLSAAIDALPETINFPIIIEVGNFGALGDLVLNNFRFGPRGSLEIINRTFSKSLAVVSASYNYGSVHDELGMNYASSVLNNKYSYYSAIGVETGTFQDYNVGAQKSLLAASCLSISTTICSATNDTRLTSNFNAFISQPLISNGYNSKYTRPTLSIASKNIAFAAASPALPDRFQFTPYDLNAEIADGIFTYDSSTIDLINGNSNHLYLNDHTSNNTHGVNSLVFGNRLDKIIVNNCEGPIYIRNFFVDGSGYNRSTNYYGVEVANSNNINLENIVSVRHRKAGFLFNDSNVNLLRGCVANRIYDFDSTGNRLTGLWSSKIFYDSYDSTLGYTNYDKAAGILSNNSTITINSTREFLSPLYKNYIIEAAEDYFTDIDPYVNVNCIFDFSKNSNGIVLNNSILQGGDTFMASSSNHYRHTININIQGNVGCGIKLTNSKLSFDGRLSVFENLNGIKLDSSVFEIDKLSMMYNQKTAIEANNSNIIYGKNLSPYGNYAPENNGPLYFSGNGQHIVLSNSKMNPVITSNMDSIYDQIEFCQTIGAKLIHNNNMAPIPAIELTNNSNVVLIGPLLKRNADHVGDAPIAKGSELSVTNNSFAKLIGTRLAATRIIGPSERINQKNIAGCYAGDNSKIEFNGPTVIAKYGIDLLAENNSTININPYSLNGIDILDISSIDLSNNLNHTSVELHATRSCVVLDNNSVFNAKDLGSFKTSWDTTGNFYSNREASGIDYSQNMEYLEAYVSAGSLQFYPNPIGPYTVNFPGADNPDILNVKAFYLAENSKNLYYLKNYNIDTNDFSSVTNGGYCVRALNNSLVNINNVNFPAGWWNSSAPYYDNSIPAANGGLCFKTFIWNIADTSQLKSSYTSVRGLYPRAAGYVGPSGVWRSSTGGIASGLPSGTQDTSSVSILDYFGAAPASANPFGTSSALNYGVFRLYFSVNPVANAFTDLSSTTNDIIPQIYSQGYQPSSSLICSADNLSSIYKIALQRNSSNNIVPSGYYYGSSIMDNGGFIRVFLDESSSDLFANAKHCSTGKSGNAKLVSIYYPYDDVEFGSSYNTKGLRSPNFFDLQRDN